jgi:hypothetical protein
MTASARDRALDLVRLLERRPVDPLDQRLVAPPVGRRRIASQQTWSPAWQVESPL